MQGNDSYKLKLDIFEGPLDLLLTLIKEKNLDIQDLSLAKVTQQYLDYVELLKEFNFENIGDYIVIAAELTRIKSRSLLPAEEIEEELDNEENELDLLNMLKEYKKYRLLSKDLNSRNLLGRDTFKRNPDNSFQDKTIWKVENTDIWKLVTSIKNLLSQEKYKEIPSINLKEEVLNQEERKSEIESIFQAKNQISFNEIFNESLSRVNIILSFLIILELIKEEIIDVKQEINNKIRENLEVSTEIMMGHLHIAFETQHRLSNSIVRLSCQHISSTGNATSLCPKKAESSNSALGTVRFYSISSPTIFWLITGQAGQTGH